MGTDGWGLQEWGLEQWGLGVGVASGPAVQNVSPPAGSQVGETETITFDVTSPFESLVVIVTAEYPNISTIEVVYDGAALAPLFRNSRSSVSPVPGGSRFVVGRTPKWPDEQVTLRVYATDASGAFLNEPMTWEVVSAATSFLVASVPIGVRSRFDPLGFGIIRPLRRATPNDFRAGVGEVLVRSIVGQILGTSRGEIPWRPSLGTNLPKIRHLRNSEALPELARQFIESALSRWEPRVQLIEVSAEGTDNTINLAVSYRIGNGAPETVQVVV